MTSITPSLLQQWVAPGVLRGLQAAFPATSSLWRTQHLSFSSSTPHQQQHQLADQQDQPVGLAFEEIYVDSQAAYTPSSSRSTAGSSPAQSPLTAVFLHGLLGSSRNWRSFSRKLAQDAAAKINRDVRVLLVDLRCHGASSSRVGLHPPHNMTTAADDVAQLIKQQLNSKAPHLIVGLSLGGKVALELLKQFVAEHEKQQQQQQHLYDIAPPIAPPEDRVASNSSSSSSGAAYPQQQQQQCLQGLPQQVWILDSQPGTVPIDVDAPTSVGRILQMIHNIPTPLDNRQVLYKLLTAQGIPLPVAQWLGSSLAPGGRLGTGNGSSSNGSSSSNSNGSNKLDWVFDIQGAAALYNAYRLTSYWDVLTKPPPDVTIHLIRGEKSDRWTPHMLQQLDDAVQQWQQLSSKQPGSVGDLQVHLLEKAGHWLQADNPLGLQAIMEPWFRDLHQNRLLF